MSRRYRDWSVPKQDKRGADTRSRLEALGFRFDPTLEEPDRYRIHSTSNIRLRWNDADGYYVVIREGGIVCHIWPGWVDFLPQVRRTSASRSVSWKTILKRRPARITNRAELLVADSWVSEAEVAEFRSTGWLRAGIILAIKRVRRMRSAYMLWIEARSRLAFDPYAAMIHLIVAHGREEELHDLMDRLMQGESAYHILDLQALYYNEFGMNLQVVTIYKVTDLEKVESAAVGPDPSTS